MKASTQIKIAILAVTFVSGSCSIFSTPEANSAATGSLIGAGIGAVVADEPLEGAALGGAAGAGAGYLYGASR